MKYSFAYLDKLQYTQCIKITGNVNFCYLALENNQSNQSANQITEVITTIAAHNYLLDVSVQRVQNNANKYEEAGILAEQYPGGTPTLVSI